MRCHEPLQLVRVSIHDVAQPSESFEVTVDSDAMVDDLIELVLKHTAVSRDRVALKLKADTDYQIKSKPMIDRDARLRAPLGRFRARSDAKVWFLKLLAK